MATPSDVVLLKNTPTTAGHAISSLANSNTVETLSIAVDSYTDKCQKISVLSSALVPCSKHTDSFQNLFGIDGYLTKHQDFKTNLVDNNNYSTLDQDSESIAREYCSRNNSCIKCEEENTMNNNTKRSVEPIDNHFMKDQRVSQEASDVQHGHIGCDSTIELHGTRQRESNIDSRNHSDTEKHRDQLVVQCPMTELHVYDDEEIRHRDKCQELLRPFSLSGEEQTRHKQNVFGVGCIPLLGLSSKAKRNSNIFVDSSAVTLPEYSTISQPPLLKESNDTKSKACKEHRIKPRELSAQILKKNNDWLLQEHSCGTHRNMHDTGSINIPKSEDCKVKENCFHHVDAGIQKMTLHNTQKLTSFDSCNCINPGSSHACASRAPTYGILNPLFDDTLRHNILDKNARFDKWESLQIRDKPSHSSFDPMNLCLPPLANAPNTQGTYYYLPYSLPNLSNESEKGKKLSYDSLVSLSSEKGNCSLVDSLGKKVSKIFDKSIIQVESKEENIEDFRQTYLTGSQYGYTSKPKKKSTNESEIAKDRSSFLSPASGEINLPYTPPDMQEELMFPNSSYGKDTEIIQNLNAQENDFILGRPTRKPRPNDPCELMKESVCCEEDISSYDLSAKTFEKITMTEYTSRRETCMTGVTKPELNQMTLGGDVMEYKVGVRPTELGRKNPLDIPGARQKNQYRLVDKRLSLPVNVPLKVDNFNQNDHVSYKAEIQDPEMIIPHCLRLNCLDPCKEGPCLNSIGKSNSLTNFRLVEHPVENDSRIVGRTLEQRRSSDSFLINRDNFEKSNITDKLEEHGQLLDRREGKLEKHGYKAAGKKRRLLIQQRSTLHEDDEIEDGRKDQQPNNIEDQMCKNRKNSNFTKSSNSTLQECTVHEQRAPFDGKQSETGQFVCTNTTGVVPPSIENPNFYKGPISKISGIKEISQNKRDFKVNECHQSSFSSDDGVAQSTGSVSQESSDNSSDSRKSLSLLDRRRNTAKRREKLKLKITDRSSSGEITEGCEFGNNILRNVDDDVQFEKLTDKKDIGHCQISQSEDHSVTSLVDDLTNYWLDSPSPNSLTPYPFLESLSEICHGTKMNPINQYAEASGFSTEPDSAISNPTSKKSESKHRKRNRIPTKPTSLTVFENPVSMANSSPDADKTLTREIVKSIIEENKSRSKSSSLSSTTDVQMDPTATKSEESQYHYNRESQILQDALTSVPYLPLVTPSPVTPRGGFLGGSTPLLPEGSEKMFPTSVDLIYQGMEEEAAKFCPADVGKSNEERRILHKARCGESSGAISKRSSVPSDRNKRHHNRPQDLYRHRHHHQQTRHQHHKRQPSSSSSSEESSSSDSSSSDSSSSSSSSDSSSSSSESSSDLEDIVHLRP